MNIESMSVTLDIILAVAALIIAYIQLRGDQRERKAEADEEARREEEKKQVASILDDLDKLEKCRDVIKNSLKNIDDIANKTGEPMVTLNSLNKAIIEYEDVFEKNRDILRKLYNALLTNEEKFPMAHGYGRYIEDLRFILNYDAVIRRRRKQGYDRQCIEYIRLYKQFSEDFESISKDKDKLADFSGQFADLLYKMMDSLEPMFEHGDRMSAVIDELNAKYCGR